MTATSCTIRIIAIALLAVCFASPVFAQACSAMPYLHQNQFDPEPIPISQLHGTAIDQNGNALPKLCVGIFSEPDHTLVRYAQSDARGEFELDTKTLLAGEYRLVGQLLGFCPANAILNLRPNSHLKNPIVLHMNVAGAGTCSYVKAKTR